MNHVTRSQKKTQTELPRVWSMLRHGLIGFTLNGFSARPLLVCNCLALSPDRLSATGVHKCSEALAAITSLCFSSVCIWVISFHNISAENENTINN